MNAYHKVKVTTVREMRLFTVSRGYICDDENNLEDYGKQYGDFVLSVWSMVHVPSDEYHYLIMNDKGEWLEDTMPEIMSWLASKTGLEARILQAVLSMQWNGVFLGDGTELIFTHWKED